MAHQYYVLRDQNTNNIHFKILGTLRSSTKIKSASSAKSWPISTLQTLESRQELQNVIFNSLFNTFNILLAFVQKVKITM